MKIYSLQTSGTDIDDELALCGRELVRRCDFQQSEDTVDDLGNVVAVCFRGGSAADDATYVCRQLNAALSVNHFYGGGYKTLVGSLLRTQPAISLDEFLGNQSEAAVMDLIVHSSDTDTKNLLDLVSPEVLISWAQIDPPVRFTKLAAAIVPFKEEKGRMVWKPTALQILNLAPDQMAILTEFDTHIRPSVWNGSLANILKSRRALLHEFMSHGNATIKSWAYGKDAEQFSK